MTETKKLTKRDVINSMLADENIQANATYVNYLTHELELLDKKNSSKGQSKTQLENENIKKDIIKALEDFARPVTVTELMPVLSLSNQKISALLKQMVEIDKTAVKTTDKKKSYFSVA